MVEAITDCTKVFEEPNQLIFYPGFQLDYSIIIRLSYVQQILTV